MLKVVAMMVLTTVMISFEGVSAHTPTRSPGVTYSVTRPLTHSLAHSDSHSSLVVVPDVQIVRQTAERLREDAVMDENEWER